MSTVEPAAATPGGEDAPLGAKHEPPSGVTSGALVQRSPLPNAMAHFVLSDDEMRRTWRQCSALAASAMFNDAGPGHIEKAFAKVLIGRDLAISPTQALMTIDIVKGNIFMRGVLLASFVRKSRQYEYKVLSRTNEGCVLLMLGFPGDTRSEHAPVAERGKEAAGDAVWHRSQWWEVLSREEFTVADAKVAGLVKADSNWVKYPKNMCFWRNISNGVKFEAPDLLGGVPVYTEADDIPAAAPALDAGIGDGSAQGLDLGPDVEDIIARAAKLGHAALADRAAIEMMLGDQPPATVVAWVKAARQELDAIPQDAVVVDAQEAPQSAAAVQTTERAPEAAAGREAPAQPVETVESATGGVDDEDHSDDGHLDRRNDPAEALAALRRRGTELLDAAQAAEDAGNNAEADVHYAELVVVEANIAAMTDTDQGSLPL